jgi:hypothetical protein
MVKFLHATASMHGLLISIVALLLLLPLTFATARAASDSNAHDIPLVTRHYGLHLLDKDQSIRLRASDNPLLITFGARADEKVARVVLKLNFLYSPLLTPLQSHIKVLLNGEIVGVLPMTDSNAGRATSGEVEIDPGKIKSFNKLTLELVAHYTADCEDPLQTNLWVDIQRGSDFTLTAQPIEIASDLALLPKPFFDMQILNLIELPFVFSAKPSYNTLRAAGIAASWFGQMASWRGVRFAAGFDAVPKGHAVVFATNTERPAFLRALGEFNGPGLDILTNPTDGYSKLLLISGRDGDDLRIAADALVLGSAAMSGSHVSINRAPAGSLRLAYDAPNWVRLDRPVKFGELVDSPQQLQVFGHTPEPVALNLRIPPDLFTWRSRGVPVDLKFRYTPTIHSGASKVAMSLNDETVQTMTLQASGQGGASARVVLPLLDSGLLSDSQELLIPAFKLGARNQIGYTFTFSGDSPGFCRSGLIENTVAMIDPDSKVDFSGFPHFAEMPHLGYFATAGFPFTKYADLAQTVIVLPDTVSAQDVEVMLTLLGRMGESTGYPATHVNVVGPKEQATFADHDLLLIGTVSQQAMLAQWRVHLPVIFSKAQWKIIEPAGLIDNILKAFGANALPFANQSIQKNIPTNDSLAALIAFESPLTTHRSVVAITAANANEMLLLVDQLRDDDMTKTMHGSVVLFNGGKVESLFAGNQYWLGSLPIWTSIWFSLSGHPILLAVMSVLAVLIFAFALLRMLKGIASRRM